MIISDVSKISHKMAESLQRPNGKLTELFKESMIKNKATSGYPPWWLDSAPAVSIIRTCRPAKVGEKGNHFFNP